MGSSALQIVLLFLKENIKLITVSILIAIPSSYLIMERWLQDFAYHIDIGLSIILIAVVSVLSITLLTVTYHTVRTALINPSKTLRYE